jgi:hypothetical protein
MKKLTLITAAVIGMIGCQTEREVIAVPCHVVFNMSEEERPFELSVDAVENDTIYVSIKQK